MKIVSGGQTGVDRAVLDAAIEAGLNTGGWCPRGRLAEDGPIPARYPLSETPAAGYDQRTEWNVRDSDGTLILRLDAVSKGTDLTESTARRLGRPLLVIDLDSAPEASLVAEWLKEYRIETLNVAGPRESEHPGIYRTAKLFLAEVFQTWR